MGFMFNRNACRGKVLFFLVSLVALTGCQCGLTEQDIEQIRKAAEQGDAKAQTNLGVMYAEGKGIPKDAQKAMKWFRKAAEQGLALAQYNLGVTYAFGKGVPKDAQKAVKWYRKAAEQGLAFAQYDLGNMYSGGRGIPYDAQKAMKWYRKAAEQGLGFAQEDLGNMYYWGEGPKDAQKAVKWYRKAAEQGSSLAPTRLAEMYFRGVAVPRDDVKAYAWTIVAGAQRRRKPVEFRDDLRRRMTTEQVAEAQKLAAELKERIEASKSK